MFEIGLNPDGSVRLSGRLDASQTERAQALLRGLSGPATLDFAELDYISSAGIGVIIETYKRLLDAGTTLRLINMTPRIRTVFGYAGLDKVMRIE